MQREYGVCTSRCAPDAQRSAVRAADARRAAPGRVIERDISLRRAASGGVIL